MQVKEIIEIDVFTSISLMLTSLDYFASFSG